MEINFWKTNDVYLENWEPFSVLLYKMPEIDLFLWGCIEK